ncbi:MAG TPA: hypothetical protein VFF81_11635 [Noviherbaspirillum sp.]|nr:hypothetical protein [Noviherbaspirillum sp.]
MDKTTLIIGISKHFETVLEEAGAVGKGLHAKIDSVEHVLPDYVVKSLRKLATIRNKQVHSSHGKWDEEDVLSEALRLAGHVACIDIKGEIERLALNQERMTPRASLFESEPEPAKLTDELIATYLASLYAGISAEDLDAAVDAANTRAMAAFMTCSDDWDGLQHIAMMTDDEEECLILVAQSIQAGADIEASVSIIRQRLENGRLDEKVLLAKCLAA